MLECKEAMDRLIKIGAIQGCSYKKGQFISTFFLVDKPDGTKRFVLNLKNLNKFITKIHFKLEDYKIASKLITENAFMARIDLKDAYHLIPMHEDSRKYLRFYFQDQLYEFVALPFGLSTAPYIFTKIVKPVLHFLRAKGLSSVVYLDDFLCISDSFEKSLYNLQTTKTLLESLGFIINELKSDTVPKMCCQFLGFIFNSKHMTIALPESKQFKILNLIISLKDRKTCKIRFFAHFIGNLIASCPTLKYSWLYTKRFEREKTMALIVNDGDYESIMYLSEELQVDFTWWESHILKSSNSIKPPVYVKEIFTDASLTGWGAYCDGEHVHGLWSLEERARHINYLELLATFLALRIFCIDLRDCDVLLRIDNTTAISYVNRMGGTKYLYLHSLSKLIWQWCEQRNIWIFASYIPSKENVEADHGSRLNNIDTEWEISDYAFSRIIKSFGKPQIDLFASRINKKCDLFCSWFKDPESTFVDAFTLNWSSFYFYAFPSFSIILRTLQKIKNEKACGILVVPYWGSQPWFPLFESLLLEPPIVFKPAKNLLLSPCRTLHHPLASKLSLIAGKLSGRHS